MDDINILQKMERRRLAKSNFNEYNKLNAEIRRGCQTAKELMLIAQCEKIEQLTAKHTSLARCTLRLGRVLAESKVHVRQHVLRTKMAT